MNYFLSIFFLVIALVSRTQEINHPHSILHSFIENKGQWDENVLFQSKFEGGNLWVQQRKFIFQIQDLSALRESHGNFNYKGDGQLKQTLVHLNFLGSKKVEKIDKYYQTKQYYNYFLGNDSTKWAKDVHGYSEAILKDLYNGIDLKLIEDKWQLKYEFHVKPNTDPSVIQLEFVGQQKMNISPDGNLQIQTELGDIIEEKPYAYQIKNGKIIEVQCKFKLVDNVVHFDLEKYDPSVQLVIDPVLIFATYSGSTTDNFGMTATFASDGKAYSGGTVYGNAYPVPDNGVYNVNTNFTAVSNPTPRITDVFISKYSADGTTMIWTNFIGGGNTTQGTETVHSLICDSDDNVYFFGATSSTDFPVLANAFQTAHNGGVAGSTFLYNGVEYGAQGTDIYVSKLSADGYALMASTYVGGSSNDGINYKVTSGNYGSYNAYDSLTKNYGDQFRGEIMLDSAGNCLVASCTRSANFPVVNAFQPVIGGAQDGVVFELSPDLSAMQWSSFYGGSNNDACYSVKVDSSYNVVFAGGTSSLNLQGTSAGYQPNYNGGITDGFVVKIPANGSSILAASYVGTSDYDQVIMVEIDRNDNVFLVGQSLGGGFPIVNAAYVDPLGSQFIVKFDPSLSTIENSTLFGNTTETTIDISPSAFLVDICGNIYVCGWGANILDPLQTPLSGMPISSDAYQSTAPNGFDFYLFVLERDFSSMLYGSYIGGPIAQEHVDGGTSRFDKNGVVYQSVCGGCFNNSQVDFITSPGAWSSVNLDPNGCNNIVFKFDFQLIPNAEFTVDNSIGCAAFEVNFDNFSTTSDSYLWDLGNGDTTSQIFEPTVIYDTPGVYEVYLYVTDSICLLTDTAQITITVTDSLELSVTPDFELCVPLPIDVTAFTNGTGQNFIWSDDINFSNILNTDQSDSVLSITPSGPTTYYVQVSNPGCSKIDSVVVDFIGSSLILSANDSLCLGESTIVTATNSNPSITFNYQWGPTSIISWPNGSSAVTVLPTSTVYVTVTASSSNGCVVEDSILINVGNIPDGAVSATSSEYSVPEGGEVTLSALPNGYSYLWFQPDLVDQPNAQNTTATINQTTLFTVFVTDGICTKSDTVLVKAYPYVCDEPFVFVPSAFSPNGDGENDVLYVYGAAISQLLLRIYDRWGELVFETQNGHIGWDGSFRGKPMDPDVYDYYLEVDCIGGQHSIIKGNITLLK